jgi:hypothetical protein
MTMQDLQREGYWPSNSIPTLPVTSGLEFYLDASVAASVDVANQLWKNLVSSPASGASQTDYDFQLGANTTSGDSDEPLHVGTPMSGHPFAYWNMGGDDYFTLPSNTSFVNSIHKDGATLTFLFLTTISNPSPAGAISFLCTGNDTNDVAFTVQYNGGDMLYSVFNGSGIITQTRSKILTKNSPRLFGVSVDENGGNVSFFYDSGDYLQTDGGSDTFDASYSSPSSSSASVNLHHYAGNGDNGLEPVPIGMLPKASILYNRALTKSEMDKLHRHFQAQGRV